MIGDSFLTLVCNAVCNLACCHKFLNLCLDTACTFGYLFNELEVSGTECIGLHRRKYLMHGLDIGQQTALIIGSDRDDVVHRKVAKYTCLNLNLLRIGLPFDLIAGFQFLAGHDTEAFEHLNAFSIEVSIENDWAGCLDIETTSGCLGLPFIRVTIAIKANGFACLDVFAQDIDDSMEGGTVPCSDKLLLSLSNTRIDTLLERGKGFGNCTVQGNHGRSAVGLTTHGTELETVARKGKGAGSVAVGVIYEQFGNLGDIHLQALLSIHSKQIVSIGFLDMIEQLTHLTTEETRNDGRWCFVGSQSMCIGGTHDTRLQKSVVTIHTHQCFDDEGGKTEILFRSLARSMEQHAIVGRETPVVVLATAVDAGKRLLVQKDTESVLAGHTLHHRHEQHVVIDSQVRFLEDGRQFELIGSHLIMACLARDAQFERFDLKFSHKGSHTLRNGTKIMIVHLLVLGRIMSHQRTTCKQQVGTCRIETFVHEEILLFPTEVRSHLLYRWVKIMADIRGSHIHGMQSTQQRSLVVKRFSRVGDEHGGDTECVINNEDGAGRIPCRVATGLESAANATARETGGIGFLLNEQLARKLFDHAALTIVFDKRIMLLGRAFGQRLEPMRIVRHSVFGSPLLHAFGHSVSHVTLQACTIVHHIDHLCIDVLRKVRVHLFAVEDFLAEILGRSLNGFFYVKGLLLESLTDNLKSQCFHNCNC